MNTQNTIADARIKLMIDKLVDQVAGGYIFDLWAETFIEDVRSQVELGRGLTEKQVAKLEQLFERY